MADVKYLNNRLKYHTASRIGAQTGYSLAQSLDVDGHIVTTNKVWAAPATAFPNNADKANVDSVDATNDLVTVFKVGAVSGAFWNGGTVWTNENYPAVKLYENVPMTAVKGSDGGGKFQAYEILAAADGVTSGTIRLTDWVAPTAVADRTNGKPVAGFSGIPMYDGTALKLADTSNWAEAGGHYEFVYIAGMLTFEPGYTPENQSKGNKKDGITLTAFKYCGEYLADSISGINDTIDTEIANIDKKIDDAVKDLNTEITNSKEIAEVTVVLADGTATPADSGKEITSVVSDAGVVTMTIKAEVLSVKQGTEEIQPDMVYAGGTTTLTADYGTEFVAGTTTWTLTYRI